MTFSEEQNPPLSKQPASGEKRSRNPRLIAFYLPQFHPIPQNDAWWGKGFTEWTNVTKAAPLFEGHYQPHLPTDLGFYDLRLRQTRHEQISLARQYGIDGFCYHYYWFSGERVLEYPLEDMLADPASDMPFCLCWANENWTRRWDGAENKVLLTQKYLPEDDLAFIRSIAPFLKDERYIRIDGAPLLIVYRPQNLPNPARTTAAWRDYCREEGIGELHLCAALTHGNLDHAGLGFDSGLEFPPHNIQLTALNGRLRFQEPFLGNVVAYHEVAEIYLSRSYPDANVYRGVCPSWDNTARTGSRAMVLLNGTPANYEFWLSEAIRKTEQDFPGEERPVFINAWNEWAEGCHLEPDRRYQRGFLEATLRARQQAGAFNGFTDTELPGSGPASSFCADLWHVVRYHVSLLSGRLAMLLKGYPRLRRFLKKMLAKLG